MNTHLRFRQEEINEDTCGDTASLRDSDSEALADIVAREITDEEEIDELDRRKIKENDWILTVGELCGNRTSCKVTRSAFYFPCG